MESVTAMNKALSDAGAEGLTVRLETVTEIGKRNPSYVVATVEIRETVLP